MPNNLKIYRVHRFFFYVYAVLSLISLISVTVLQILGESDKAMFIGAVLITFLALMHYGLAHGAARANIWSKTASGLIAFMFLFGFPIGTVLGVYMLFNLRDWPSAVP